MLSVGDVFCGPVIFQSGKDREPIKERRKNQKADQACQYGSGGCADDDGQDESNKGGRDHKNADPGKNTFHRTIPLSFSDINRMNNGYGTYYSAVFALLEE